MGSTSSGDPAAASLSADSLHGLKFGKKIYFEDAGGSAGAHTSSSSSSSSGAKKSRGAGQGCVQQQQQPPRCQVEGCGEDLSGEKAYYCRHKVCVMHSKFPKVVVAGLEQRFCQQCSRFHQLPEFDQGKRSCRRRLAGHNERRRKPPPLSLPLQYGQFTSTFHDDRSRYGGLMMDFTHPVPQGAGRHTWPLIRSGEHVTVAQLPITTGGVTPPGRLSITQSRSFACSSAAGTLFSGHDIPPDGYIGTSQHSSCALSLLSTQSWGTPQLTVRAPVVQQSHFESNPMAQPTIPTSLHSNAWGLGRQEAYGAAHEASPHTSMARATQQVFSRRQFPGELELALQGSGQSADQVHEHEFFQPGNEMHWSL